MESQIVSSKKIDIAHSAIVLYTLFLGFFKFPHAFFIISAFIQTFCELSIGCIITVIFTPSTPLLTVKLLPLKMIGGVSIPQSFCLRAAYEYHENKADTQQQCNTLKRQHHKIVNWEAQNNAVF